MFFENNLGFRGILIEPVKEFYDKLVVNRRKNILYNNVISEKEDDVEILVNGAVSGITDNMHPNFRSRWHSKSATRTIKAKRLSDIFKEKYISYIDFFSLDVECRELDVLKTIDWNNISIYLICIELSNHSEEKVESCRRILLDHGFVFQTRICINEFWLNPNYKRKHLLYNENKSTFSGNVNDYGNHIYLEPHCKSEIENKLIEFEKYKQ